MQSRKVGVKVQLIAAAVLACLPVSLPAQSSEFKAFDAIKALKGDWVGKMSGGMEVTSSFRITAAGSAVIQMLGEGTEMEMPTLYHLDGVRVIATHYCAAQNQPRMVLEQDQDPAKSLKFRFLDITNLKSPQAAHMREVEFRFLDRDHIQQVWTSRENGKDSSDVFDLVRKR